MEITQRRPRAGLLVLILGSLAGLGALTIDMYLPAMPQMARDLDAGAPAIQLTLTVFVIGLAVGQLVAGPLSDAWGRRRPLLAGLGLYVAGSVLCVLAPSAGWLTGARALQSLGAAAAAVICRAVVRDLYDGAAMTRFFSTLMLVNGVAPVIAPLIGGGLLELTTWRAVFVVLGVTGAVLAAAVAVALPESLPAGRRRPARPRQQLGTYATLLRDRGFLGTVLAGGLMFGAVFAYISGSSFVLQDVHGLTAVQFSLVFGANGLGIVLLGQVNARLVGRVADERTLLGAGLAVATVGGAGVLACTALGLPLWALLACLFTTVSMLGMVLANASSLALAAHRETAGSASALLGLVQFASGGLASGLLGLAGGGAVALGAVMFLFAAAAVVSLHALRGREAAQPESLAWSQETTVPGTILSQACRPS